MPGSVLNLPDASARTPLAHAPHQNHLSTVVTTAGGGCFQSHCILNSVNLSPSLILFYPIALGPVLLSRHVQADCSVRYFYHDLQSSFGFISPLLSFSPQPLSQCHYASTYRNKQGSSRRSVFTIIFLLKYSLWFNFFHALCYLFPTQIDASTVALYSQSFSYWNIHNDLISFILRVTFYCCFRLKPGRSNLSEKKVNFPGIYMNCLWAHLVTLLVFALRFHRLRLTLSDDLAYVKPYTRLSVN